MLKENVLTMVKNGDGVYEVPPYPMGLLPGPRSPIPKGDYIEFGTLQIGHTIIRDSDFNRGIIKHTPPKRGCAKPPKAKHKEITKTDLKNWIISATKKECRKEDTALSFAFYLACEKRLGKEGRQIVANIVERELARTKSKVITALAAIELSKSKLQMKPLAEHLKEAKEKGWIWCDHKGYYIRATMLDIGVTHFHVGTSVKPTVKRLKKPEEVRCG
jgi:hypothetical protein